MDDIAPSQFSQELNNLETNIVGFNFAGENLAQVLSTSSPFSPVNLLFYAIGAWFLINTVLAGINLMTSGGEPAKVNSSKTRITNSIIGILVAVTAYWVVRIIGLALGLSSSGPDGGF